MCRSWRNAPRARSRSGGIPAASGRTQRRPRIEAYSIAGMGHGVPLATTGVRFCGMPGRFSLKRDLLYLAIARFWGLDTAEARVRRTAAQAATEHMFLHQAFLHWLTARRADR